MSWRKWVRRTCFVGLGSVGATWACSHPVEVAAERPVATIDATIIDGDQLRRAWALERLAADGAGGTHRADEVRQLHAVLDGLVVTRMVVLEAQAEHVTIIHSDIDAALAQISRGFDEATWQAVLLEHHVTGPQLRAFVREKLLVEQYLKSKIGDRIAILDSAVDDYVLAHPEVLMAPAQVHLKQILLTDPNQVAEVRTTVRKGLTLPEAAARFSHAPEGTQGGDLGLVDETSVPKAIWQHVARLPLRQLSTPFNDVLGIHLFWLSERLPARKLKLKEVRQQIEHRLRQSAETEATRAYLASLKESHHVVVDPSRLSELEAALCVPR